jgi:RNA polymerase sigma-70 factor (sigma-E family)
VLVIGRSRPARPHDDDFTAFVAGAAPGLRRTAYLMCRDWHLAQDLVQTTFAKIYVVWPKIYKTANLTAYSRRVLMNVIFDQRKRRSASELVLADLPDGPLSQPGREMHIVLLEALARLSVRDQAIVVLRHWEDQSVASVASILDMSVPAVKTANARALDRLRDVLGADFLVS